MSGRFGRGVCWAWGVSPAAAYRLVASDRLAALAALLRQPREVERDRRGARVGLLRALVGLLGRGGGEGELVGLLGGLELAQLVSEHADVVPQLEGHAALRALEQARRLLVGAQRGLRLLGLVQLGELEPRAHVLRRELGRLGEVLQRERAPVRRGVEVAERAQRVDRLGVVLERALEEVHGL